MAPIIVFVRYSVVLDDPRPFLIGRKSREEYVRAVLDPERLRTRNRLFRHLTLASLAGQNVALDVSWFRLCVLISDNLPAEARADLEEAVRPYPWARIELWRDLKGLTVDTLSDMAGTQPLTYATLRLDDDDGLSRDFVARMLAYCRPDLVDHAVSFCSGYAARYSEETGRLVDFASSYKPYTAIGLAHIGAFDRGITSRMSHIFEAGKHTTIDRRLPAIVDATFPAYVRTLYPSQDTGAAQRREFEEKARVSQNIVAQHVSIGDPLLLP